MDPTFIDAHCHLADPRFSDSLDAVILRSEAANVYGWVLGGVSPEDWERQVQIQKQYGAGVVTSFGLHPGWVSDRTEAEVREALLKLESQIAQAQAIGELGLDFGPRHSQSKSLELQR